MLDVTVFDVGVEMDNRQFVVSIRNRFSFEQTWFNKERRRKPQSFVTRNSLDDPTENGAECDFCDAYNLTGVDEFGRSQDLCSVRFVTLCLCEELRCRLLCLGQICSSAVHRAMDCLCLRSIIRWSLTLTLCMIS